MKKLNDSSKKRTEYRNRGKTELINFLFRASELILLNVHICFLNFIKLLLAYVDFTICLPEFV